MEFLRKTLVVVFGILSLFFAVVAVLKHVAQSGDKGSETSAYIIDWNSDFRDTAKKASRPVFLLMTPDTRMLQDPEVSDILKNHYTVARMNTEAYPADYELLKSIYHLGGARGEPKAAILTPSLIPIIIASKLPYTDTTHMPALPSALIGFAKLCKDGDHQFLATAKRIGEKLSDEHSMVPFVPEIFSENEFGVYSVWSVAEIIWLMRTSKSADIPDAVLCENARLAFAIFARNPRATNRAIAYKAAYEILRRLQEDKSDNPLYLRALASAATVLGDKNLCAAAVSVADKILKNRNSEGLFFEKKRFPISENALMASALCHVYKASGQIRFLEAARLCADTLTKAMAESPKALAFESSQASLGDVAYCARACADIYILTRDERFRRNTIAFVNMAYNNFYNDGIFRNNSNSSPLSHLARPLANKDSFLPSPDGVMAQIESDKRNLNILNEPFSTFKISDKLSELSARNLSVSPFENLSKASLRLAFMPNILMK